MRVQAALICGYLTMFKENSMTIRLVLKDRPGNCTLLSIYPGFIEEMKKTETTVYNKGHKIGMVFYNGSNFNGVGDVQYILDTLNN